MGTVPISLELYRSFDPPYEKFERSLLGPQFAAELDLVSRLWFRCGYRPGIGAYLNFFLLRDFITTHDTNFPPRFKSLTGGISSAKVRDMLHAIQERHVKVRIPPWMQTYFGWSLLENVEKQCAPLRDERASMERFARAIEAEQAALGASVAKHARHILRIGEMIGVPSGANSILAMLPQRTRAVFEPLYPKVRPGTLRALWCRVLGRLLTE